MNQNGYMIQAGRSPDPKDLFLEHPEGYVKALEISTSLSLELGRAF